ncbi:hypothetical protein [Nocardia noduli]|uniref:hypothetical protein n=1 Tax=Nocardia noduli TaxID=2815722 RepID=UPI001C210F65|nr:hypothetical protein [Nocardia noduli]
MQINDSVDRQALLDAGLDPDDPQVWAVQREMQVLSTWHGVRTGHRRIDPDDPQLHR